MAATRSASSIIWKTVVCAGAMLGSAACGGTPPPAKATKPEVVAVPVDAAPQTVAVVPVDATPVPEVVEAPPPVDPPPVVAPDPIQLEVTSKPAGALVYLGDDSTPLGKTPLTFSVEPPAEGQPVRFVKKGYEPRTILVTADGTVNLTPDVEKGQPQLSIRSSNGKLAFDVALTKVQKKKKRVRGAGEGGTGRGFVLS